MPKKTNKKFTYVFVDNNSKEELQELLKSAIVSKIISESPYTSQSRKSDECSGIL